MDSPFGPRPARKGTLCITHLQCLTHVTRSHLPEQPARVQSVMQAIRQLADEVKLKQPPDAASSLMPPPPSVHAAAPFDVVELDSSPAMLAMLEAQLTELTHEQTQTGLRAALQRTESVVYLESTILPAVRAVHTRRYLDKLRSRCEHLSAKARQPNRLRPPLARNLSGVTGDTFVSASSLSAALCAALTACRAVDAVARGECPNAFAAIRPPGHHAGADGTTAGPLSFAAAASAAAGTASTATGSSATSAASSSTSLAIGSGAESDTASDSGAVSDAIADDRCGQGFCLLNNAAIAAKHALLRYPEMVRRVAIIDVDLHHGNGTEEIVRTWTDVLYASLHGCEDNFFPMTGTELDVSSRLVNVPLPRGTTPEKYLAAYDEHVAPAVRAFAPDLIIISTGFDAHRDDAPDLSGFLALSESTFAELTRRLARLAVECCAGRMVSLLEGGYNLKAIAKCAQAHVAELALAANPFNPACQRLPTVEGLAAAAAAEKEKVHAEAQAKAGAEAAKVGAKQQKIDTKAQAEAAKAQAEAEKAEAAVAKALAKAQAAEAKALAAEAKAHAAAEAQACWQAAGGEGAAPTEFIKDYVKRQRAAQKIPKEPRPKKEAKGTPPRIVPGEASEPGSRESEGAPPGSSKGSLSGSKRKKKETPPHETAGAMSSALSAAAAAAHAATARSLFPHSLFPGHSPLEAGLFPGPMAAGIGGGRGSGFCMPGPPTGLNLSAAGTTALGAPFAGITISESGAPFPNLAAVGSRDEPLVCSSLGGSLLPPMLPFPRPLLGAASSSHTSVAMLVPPPASSACSAAPGAAPGAAPAPGGPGAAASISAASAAVEAALAAIRGHQRGVGPPISAPLSLISPRKEAAIANALAAAAAATVAGGNATTPAAVLPSAQSASTFAVVTSNAVHAPAVTASMAATAAFPAAAAAAAAAAAVATAASASLAALELPQQCWPPLVAPAGSTETLMGAEMGASAAPSAGPGAMLRPPAAKKPRVLAPAAATPLAAVGDA